MFHVEATWAGLPWKRDQWSQWDTTWINKGLKWNEYIFLYLKKQMPCNQRQLRWKKLHGSQNEAWKVLSCCNWLFLTVSPIFYTWTHRNIHAGQQLTICLSSHSSLSLSTGRLWSAGLIRGRARWGKREVVGGGWRGLGCSQGSPLIDTIWVGWQHFSCASSSQSDNPYRMSLNASRPGWEELTSVWPLGAIHASRLTFPSFTKPNWLTYQQACLICPENGC